MSIAARTWLCAVAPLISAGCDFAFRLDRVPDLDGRAEGCPSFATLSLADDFAGATYDAVRWGDNLANQPGTIAIEGGALKLQPPSLTGPGYPTLISNTPQNICGSAVFVELVVAPKKNMPTAATVGAKLQVFDNADWDVNERAIVIDNASLLYAFRRGLPTIGSGTYVEGVTRFFRISEHAGTLAYDVAQDPGGPWMPLADEPTPPWICTNPDVRVGLQASVDMKADVSAAKFDNLDVCPP